MPTPAPQTSGSRFLPPPPTHTTFAGGDDNYREGAFDAFDRVFRSFVREFELAEPPRIPSLLRSLKAFHKVIVNEVLFGAMLVRETFAPPTPDPIWDEVIRLPAAEIDDSHELAMLSFKVESLISRLEQRMFQERIPWFAEEL